MKRAIIVSMTLCIAMMVAGQETGSRSQYIGINIPQLIGTQLNLNYSAEIWPYFTPYIEIGYGINVKDQALSPPYCDCDNDGYTMDKISGAYGKLGIFINLRKSFQKNNYFHFGLFFNNTSVYEKGIYEHFTPDMDLIKTPVSHTKYITGMSVSVGYRFRMWKRFRSSVNFQLSFPDKTYKDLYGYENYIPGMGGKNYDGYYFPMLIWNVQYSFGNSLYFH